MYPPFVMSKYASRESLNKDKADYYEQLAKTLAANADNDKLSDADFRQMVRNSIPEFKTTNAELCGGPSGPSERAPGYASAPKTEE